MFVLFSDIVDITLNEFLIPIHYVKLDLNHVNLFKFGYVLTFSLG